MATESTFVWDESYTAAADLSANQFYPVKFTADNTVGLCTAATDRAIGILQNKPKSGEAAVVRHLGRSKAIADGSGTAIAAGDLVGSNASGVLVKKATTDYAVIGQATVAATASGAIMGVNVLMPGMVFRTTLG